MSDFFLFLILIQLFVIESVLNKILTALK